MTPSVRAMFGDLRATPAALIFLRERQWEEFRRWHLGGENWWDGDDGSESEGEEGGPGGSWNVILFFFSLGATLLCCGFLFFFLLSFLKGGLGSYDRLCRCVARENGYMKIPPPVFRQRRSRCHSPSGCM